MIGLGPIGGHTSETGMAIASDDPVAADVVGAKLLGFSVSGVHHLWEAGRMGLGETELERIEFPLLGMEEAFRAFTTAAYDHALDFSHA